MTSNYPLQFVPLAVAVGGHRELHPAHEDMIAQQISAKFEELGRRYRHTSIRCLSGLSEGAGMIGAEVALQRGMELVVVLPSKPEVFCTVFDSPAHAAREAAELKKRFFSLVQGSSQLIVLEEGQAQSAAQDSARVGKYLARHSHLLLAVGDGEMKGGEAGHVVKLFLGEEAYWGAQNSPCCLLDAPESRIVHHLHVDVSGEQQETLSRWRRVEQNKEDDRNLDRKLLALDRFNSQVSRFFKNDAEVLAYARESLGLGNAPGSGQMARLMGVYAAADRLAVYFQGRVTRTLKRIFGCALAMLVSFSLYSNIYGSLYLLWVYVFAFGFGAAVFFHAWITQAHNQFLDYRGLAEGLRVQIFFRLAGVPAKVHGYYLRKFRSEITWVRDVLRTIDSRHQDDVLDLEAVKRCWIDNQAAYFQKSSRRDGRCHAKFSLNALILFGAGLALACAMLFLQNSRPEDFLAPDVGKWILLFIGFLPASAALLSGYAYRLGLDQHRKQYSRMQVIFERASQAAAAMDLARDATSFRELVEELGKEALAENADWMLLHRDRPIPLPQ